MTVRFETRPAGASTATFSIASGDHIAVSVVGSFNDWTPGADPLEPNGEGSLAAAIAVEPGDELHFRYLGTDGHWFDDPDADLITEYGSVVTVPHSTSQPTQSTTAQPSIEDAAIVDSPPTSPQTAARDDVLKARKRTRA